MSVIALTGGIGSGKSTVGKLLAKLGAHVVDADQVARLVTAPTSQGAEAVLAAFGDKFRGADGGIDRAELARLVFADAASRARLEAIVHPLVAAASAKQLGAVPADRVAIYELPLLTADDRPQFAAVVVVNTPIDLRLERLVRRGVSRADGIRRMAAQPSDDERLRLADFVIENSGTEVGLEQMVGRLWDDLKVVTAGD